MFLAALLALVLAPSCGPGGQEKTPEARLAYSTYDGSFLTGPHTSFFGLLDRPKKLADLSGEFLTWDGGGEKLAFFDGHNLVVTDDGARVRYLSDDVAIILQSAPAWSPDGRRIAYGCEEDRAGSDICVASPTEGR